MENSFRIETDSMGEMRVPTVAYYGAQTARAVENFPISSLRFSRQFIRALGLIKKHATAANSELALLPQNLALTIQQAAQEVVDGKLDEHFVVDIFQTGSGTSTNMNANEVIANRATELLGGQRGDKLVHPNDHVNCGQSSNDVIPSAIHLAALEGVEFRLCPALAKLHEALVNKAKTVQQHHQDRTHPFTGCHADLVGTGVRWLCQPD
jgi:fumarate hydratase class II